MSTVTSFGGLDCELCKSEESQLTTHSKQAAWGHSSLSAQLLVWWLAASFPALISPQWPGSLNQSLSVRSSFGAGCFIISKGVKPGQTLSPFSSGNQDPQGLTVFRCPSDLLQATAQPSGAARRKTVLLHWAHLIVMVQLLAKWNI